MLKLIDLISREVSGAFSAAGYDEAYGKVTVSNRPDLCEYQCNGALPAAKVYHKPPMAIAEDVAAQLAGNANFERVEACRPGFINLRLSPASLADYLEKMRTSERFGVEPDPAACRMIIDYGGPNVAKPLHVGHLRSAIIGESLKRIFRFFGNDVVGDIHMGDWGLQMGLIIAIRSCPISMRRSPANTPPKRPLPSPISRKSTPPPPPKARPTRRLPPRLMT